MSDILRTRRQNNSCEQCKRSKKACDGYWVNNGGAFPLDLQDEILPCSYCVKTRKRCSLNSNWVAQSERSPFSSSDGGFSEQGINSQASLLMYINPSDTSSVLRISSPALDWGTPLPDLGAAVSGDNALLPLDTGPSLDIDLHAGAHNVTLETTATPSNYLARVEEYSPSQVPHGSASQATDFDNLTTTSGISQSHSMPTISGYSIPTAYQRRTFLRKRYRARRRSDDWSERFTTSPSPSYTSQGPMSSFNNNLISESLLRIYHDVLENNLACWLAKDTCPYKMQPRSQLSLDQYLDTNIPMNGGASTNSERGRLSSNSIYRRVKLLDRVAQSSGLIKLTCSESRAASKALDLVVMAFATQWPQGRRRREKMFPNSPDPFDPELLDDVTDEFVDEFEESFQHSLWEQAKRALQDVASLESYRIVYAELIFGLIQRPWTASSYSRASAPRASYNSSSKSIKTSLPEIMEIISQDGPPIYTERAGRKIQALKFHFEASETGIFTSNYAYSTQQQKNLVSKMSSEERGTIGQLYWLAVMFDTVSSSMNERPVALADKDCQHESATIDQSTSHRWELELFAQDDPEKPSTLSWPCSYDSAVRAVTRSAAVKVLLFRYVSYLQNTLRKGERSYAIEEIIQSATQIYRYWNVTHGAFFRSLIKNYDSVPSRIKSWFPCIHIPWHLGAFMLADMIEFVDQNKLGSEEASLNRQSLNFAARIRKLSAIELSDLATVTTPQESDNMPTEQLPGYHFAVNEGSILTEPWTVLLIRAFTKASIFHLSVAEDLRLQDWAVLGQESEEFKVSLKRCDACIRALWFLGRKSDMARSISRILANILRGHETDNTCEGASCWYLA
ncbi:hypothetical protein GGR51DRAFT_160455 [Nemania sp. FL0031]|nr:hypothetical protein GGR51DRAFT_160455 [Nemania sp. FL0031]